MFKVHLKSFKTFFLLFIVKTVSTLRSCFQRPSYFCFITADVFLDFFFWYCYLQLYDKLLHLHSFSSVPIPCGIVNCCAYWIYIVLDQIQTYFSWKNSIQCRYNSFDENEYFFPATTSKFCIVTQINKSKIEIFYVFHFFSFIVSFVYLYQLLYAPYSIRCILCPKTNFSTLFCGVN